MNPSWGSAASTASTYRTTDGDATSDTATVTVAVANGAPVAVDDEARPGGTGRSTVAVLANDTDPDGDP